jgi:Snf7
VQTVRNTELVSWVPDSSATVAVTMWQLQQVQSEVDQCIQTWHARAEECRQKALQAQKLQQKNRALYEMKRRHLYLQHMDQAYATLLNVEQIQHSLETARHQSKWVDALSLASATMQGLRNEQDLERVEESLDKLQEEIHSIVDVGDTLESFSRQHQRSEVDEDDLWKELQELSLDTDTTPPPPSGMDTVPSDKKVDMSLEARLNRLSDPLPVHPTQPPSTLKEETNKYQENNESQNNKPFLTSAIDPP